MGNERGRRVKAKLERQLLYQWGLTTTDEIEGGKIGGEGTLLLL